MSTYTLCSECFRNEGLRLDAERLGIDEGDVCGNCGQSDGQKLTREAAEVLAYRFFVWGSLQRTRYGGAPQIQFNRTQSTDIELGPWLESDVELLSDKLGLGFFYYGPPLWMVGEIEPLLALRDPATRGSVIQRILEEYPRVSLSPDKTLYRVRINPQAPSDPSQYDSPPDSQLGTGRLDSTDLPVLYASPDLQLCLHECRVAAEDQLYVATLRANRQGHLLDLSAHLTTEGTAFASLDLAVHFLFLAADHSYKVSRAIARAVFQSGFDGLIYPSYFSLLRTGRMPFATSWGMSHRMFPELADREAAKIVPNLGLFGRPISDGWVDVECINRLVLTRVDYEANFGPMV